MNSRTARPSKATKCRPKPNRLPAGCMVFDGIVTMGTVVTRTVATGTGEDANDDSDPVAVAVAIP